MTDMDYYKYEGIGDMYVFDKFVGKFKGETMAQTEKKAKSNFVYQAKQKCNLKASSGLKLVNLKITKLY